MKREYLEQARRHLLGLIRVLDKILADMAEEANRTESDSDSV